MKIRNKKTGEIWEIPKRRSLAIQDNDISFFVQHGTNSKLFSYCSLAELNEEWEDYKPDKPKRYRLLKDLPTFEAGDEFYIAHTGALWYDGGGDDYEDDVCAYSTQTLMKFPNILEEWFEEIKPAEPLIKDEKVRKAVRAWAEADGADEKIFLTIDENGSRFTNKYGGYIEFAFRIDMEDRLYSITELCGEEE